MYSKYTFSLMTKILKQRKSSGRKCCTFLKLDFNICIAKRLIQ